MLSEVRSRRNRSPLLLPMLAIALGVGVLAFIGTWTVVTWFV